MPRITTDSVSNADASKETATLVQQGKPVYWPPVHHGGLEGVEEERTGLDQAYHPQQMEPPAQSARKSEWVDHVVATTDLGQEEAEAMTKAQLIEHVQGKKEEGEGSSAGTSSSASGKKQDKTGSSVQETEPSLQSPAQTVESPSGQDQAPKPPSSTAPSTSGSTQTTGLSLPDQSNSSEEALQTDQQPTDGQSLIHEARLAYNEKDFGKARELLEQAREEDPSVSDEVATALEAVATAEASQVGGRYSEEDPGSGGMLVQ